MMIGIDARMYKEGLGIGRYIEKLLASLELVKTDDRFVIFLRKKHWNSYSPSSDRFKKVLADIPWYSLREQIILPFIFAREKIDIMHFTHFNAPLMYWRPCVVTIHDLIMLHQPRSSVSATTRNWLVRTIKYLAYTFLIRLLVVKARSVITVSHAVKDDLVALLHVNKSKIRVIYEACDGMNVGNMSVALPPNIRKPFILYAGNAYPHKNLETLLQAMKILDGKGIPLCLALCGQEDIFYRRIKKKIVDLNLNSRVTHLGYVSEDLLSMLYSQARAYVLPSYEEGFGLPALEAQCSGLPVLASRIPCLTEILGNSALFFDPANPKDLADSLQRLCDDDSLRQEMTDRGKANVKRFSWDITAQQTYECYTKK